jgi:hypothetical protein
LLNAKEKSSPLMNDNVCGEHANGHPGYCHAAAFPVL